MQRRVLTTKRKNKGFLALWLLGAACLFSSVPVLAQSNLKEGNNQYALYTKSGDVKQLDQARTYSDNAYKTRRDSLGFRNNLLRALVYSTLSVVDSNRTKKYSEDPLITAEKALENLTDRQLVFENEPEIKHATRFVANGHLMMANRALSEGKDQEAYDRFMKIHRMASDTYDVRHNLAVLSDRLGLRDEAIERYRELLQTPKTAKASYIQALADLYEKSDLELGLVNILVTGNEMYPEDRDILFRLINTYHARSSYDAIVPLADTAIEMDPESTDLRYILAFAFEETGDVERAKEQYEALIALDRNNYEGNLGLGLIHLQAYLDNPEDRASLNRAQDLLLRANQIKPSGVNTLRSLAVLYENKGDIIQLERVNNILDQLTLH